MAMTTDEIKKYIDQVGGNIIKEAGQDTFSVIAFSKYNNTTENKDSYVIYLRENGELIQFISGMGSSNIGGVSKSNLLEALLHHNSETKFGAWDYDKNDDQINYTVEIPLEDNTLTEKQFKRIVKILESSTIVLLKIIHELQNSSTSDGI